MTPFNTEQFATAQKSNLDLMQQITARLFEGAEKLTQLQFKTLRATSEEQFDSVRKLMSARDPQAFADVQASLTQPAAQVERLLEFNREVYGLIANSQAEITKLAEGQVQANVKQVQEFAEAVAKNAPVGAEPAVAAFKSAMENANTAYDGAQKVFKQAAEMADSGVAAATSAARKAAPKA